MILMRRRCGGSVDGSEGVTCSCSMLARWFNSGTKMHQRGTFMHVNCWLAAHLVQEVALHQFALHATLAYASCGLHESGTYQVTAQARTMIARQNTNHGRSRTDAHAALRM
jgi:uncharacterized protein YaaW (UPF0174 family)